LHQDHFNKYIVSVDHRFHTLYIVDFEFEIFLQKASFLLMRK